MSDAALPAAVASDPVRSGLGRVRQAWETAWFAPAAPTNLAVARVLTAATALWIVLSRPGLPAILDFPRAMWRTVPHERLSRFLLGADVGFELVLWGVLHVTLALTLLGIATRWSALASALLLYHFAPLETIFRNGNPYLRGFTIPTLALLVIAASSSGGNFMRRLRGTEAWSSWQHRWPVTAIQVLFCFLYLAAGYSKLFTTGIAWMHGENIRNYILAIHQALEIGDWAPGLWIAEIPLLCTMMGISGVVIEFAFPFVMISRVMRRVMVPTMLVFHLLNAVVFHINFQNVLLLLVFVDWEALVARRGLDHA